MNKTNEGRYSLFGALMLLIGAVVGSGIFYKSDNILIATNGSVTLGVMVFVFGAIAIVFGALTLSELAARNSEPGGIITWMRVFVNEKASSAFGWFMTFVLFPTVSVVLSWVSGIYLCITLGIDASLNMQFIIGFAILVVFFIVNISAPKVSVWFQSATSLVKLVPLFLIAILGIFTKTGASTVSSAAHTSAEGSSTFFTALAAVPAVAFSYDGWTTSTMMSSEIKNSKRNFPIVLVVCPIIILILYVAYFVGIVNLIGVDNVMEMGDAHFAYAITKLFGQSAAGFINAFVFLAIMGVTNVVVNAEIRAPYSLAVSGDLPFSEKIKVLNSKDEMPMNSAVLGFAVCVLWYIIHYFTTKYNLLPNSDISEISCVTSYLCYCLLYLKVFKMGREKQIGAFKGIVCPIFAMLGALIIFAGGVQSSTFALYIAIGIVVLSIGYFYHKRKENSK